MSKEFSAARLDVRAFAQSQGHLQDQTTLSVFPRLAQDAQPDAGDTHGQVHWQADGELVEQTGGPGQVWLHLQADAVVPMVCQRCLALAPITLQVDRSFRFVADEATAESEDDESDEDLLVLSREFNLLELIEDELLMELPVVPRHDFCPETVSLQSSDADFEQAIEDKPNPFAVLRGLDVGKSAD
ncbi:YceD family protein [Delftia acidovorans]|uniref:YceD family protein n=1 Tax=Delftia acidovorans TaxID=80866 RepID=UPI0028F0CE93|nr:YceD family protein [Delftia acidovorans]